MIVVDSCAVVDALSGVGGAGELRAALVAEELHAPTLLDYEVVSALRGLTPDPAATGVGPARQPSYDAVYVVLAEALDCPLLTRDARLARSSGRQARVVVG